MRKFYSLNNNGRQELQLFWQRWSFISEQIDKLKGINTDKYEVDEVSKDGLDSFKTIKQDKAEYKASLERVKILPKDYRIIYEEITKFLWQFSSGNGMDRVYLNQDLLEFFEESAAADIPVSALIGGDVGAFAENTLHEYQAKTWINSQKIKMNQRIAKKLEQ